MSDDEAARIQRLEAELSAMRPRPVRDELMTAIAERLGASSSSSARPRSDRFLMGAMSAGAIAACVIACVVAREVSDVATSRSAPSSPPAMAEAPTPRFGDSTLLFARADVGRTE